MADSNERWRPHLAFETPAPRQPVAPEPDRSWMPAPTCNTIGGVDWWRNGGSEKVWRPAVTWAQRDQPEFAAKLQAAEAELGGLEKTLPPFHPRIRPARAVVSGHYTTLNRLFDTHTKSQPLVRY